MKKIFIIIFALAYLVPSSLLRDFKIVQKAQAAFDSSNLISDGEFVNIDSISTTEIQAFLNERGGFLRNYSEGGRSAAQIIYDAAHGSGEASGSINGITINTTTGTINPKAILVTLQKEQSLLTLVNQNDDALRAAMGYACPDSGGCNSAYAGFTKQVENGAWQLRYNYERAQGNGFSDYQVGQSFSFSDVNGTNTGTFGNRATAALYRYTPHVYNGNYNFWNNYNNWFGMPLYDYQIVSQSAHLNLIKGEAGQLTLTLKNTGSLTWNQNTVRLATERERDRTPVFYRESTDGSPSGWFSTNRVNMQQTSVSSGQNATFVFYFKVPQYVSTGTYREYFRPVADGVTWMKDLGIYWDVKVLTTAETYTYSVSGQNGFPTLMQGESNLFSLIITNTGKSTWTRDIVKLGTDRNADRTPVFIRESNDNSPSGWLDVNRITMQETSVAPGQNATFNFYMRVPSGITPGTYREYFRPVAEGITWMNDCGIYWDVRVLSTAETYNHSFVTQSAYPSISRGNANQFTLVITNTGRSTWQKGTVRLGTDRGQDRIPRFIREPGQGNSNPSGWVSGNRIDMQETTVAPGQNATFVFYMQAPADLSPGVYREYFRVVADGIKWMEDYGIYWDVTVI